MKRERLSAEELTAALENLDGWSIKDKFLNKRLEFENFASALDFVNHVGDLAEAADHHPDIAFGWGYADISLTTHDRTGITDVDVALARKIDEI